MFWQGQLGFEDISEVFVSKSAYYHSLSQKNKSQSFLKFLGKFRVNFCNFSILGNLFKLAEKSDHQSESKADLVEEFFICK